MNLGKVSETIVRRSILKEIHRRREEVVIGAGIGEDCAILQLQKEESVVLATNTMTYDVDEMGRLLVHNVANNLVTMGATPIGLELSILLPARAREVQIKRIMSEVNHTCEQLGMEIVGGSTEVTDGVIRPVLTATGIGKCASTEPLITNKINVEEDIVMSKWIALQGTATLARKGEEGLKKRFSSAFVEEMQSYGTYASILPEANIAREYGVTAMHDVSRGGIFQALWELIREAQMGFEVDMRKMKVKQETIELCEYYQINPYALDGTGALLMVTEDGAGLVKALGEAHIEAAVIGRTKAGNDKIIYNEDQRRCLEATKLDEYYKAAEQIEQGKR